MTPLSPPIPPNPRLPFCSFGTHPRLLPLPTSTRTGLQAAKGAGKAGKDKKAGSKGKAISRSNRAGLQVCLTVSVLACVCLRVCILRVQGMHASV